MQYDWQQDGDFVPSLGILYEGEREDNYLKKDTKDLLTLLPGWQH